MPNPFDEIVKVNEKDSKEHRESGFKKEKDKVNISLSFRKINLERIVLLAIIILLTILVFVNPFCNCNPPKNNITGETIKYISAKDSSKNQSNTTKDDDKSIQNITSPKTNDSVQEENKTSGETEKEKTFEEGFVFGVAKFDFTTVDGKPTLMKSIDIVMKNDWKTFKPLLKVYWYDDDSGESIKERVRATWIGPTFKKGNEMSITLNDFQYKLIEQGKTTETVKFELFDRETNELLDTFLKQLA